MITYIYGTDKYRIKEYLREHAPDAVVGEEALKTRGLFGLTPVILYDPPKNLKIPENVDVFIISEKKIKKGVEFQPLKGREINTWIQQELKKEGLAIAPDALALLVGRYVDSWQMKLELDKLCNYSYGKSIIEKNDVAAITTANVEENIFKLTDAVANRNKAEAVFLLDRQLAFGADPYYLFSMIVSQFRNMIAPSRPGVHPYAAQKARLAARKFDRTELEKRYQDLHRLEIEAKSGIQDITDGLYGFVFGL